MYATFGKYVNHESTYNPDSFIFRQNKVVAYSVFCYNGGWYNNLNNGGDKTRMDEKRNETAPPPTSLNVRLPKRQEKQQSALPSGRVKLNNMH